jgi:biotin carboxyl carrier protein
MIYDVKVDNKDYKLEIVEGEKSLQVKVNGQVIKLDNYSNITGRLAMVLQNNHPYEFEISKNESAYDCWFSSRLAQCEVVSEKEALYAKLMGNGSGVRKAQALKAPMPGLVLSVEVENGQKVKKGDGLIIVEAMKMENELKASRSGTIREIKVNVGQAVEKNQALIIFE